MAVASVAMEDRENPNFPTVKLVQKIVYGLNSLP
jgi:hypothetical protein